MDTHNTPITQPIAHSSTTHRRLKGRWLTASRITWIVLFVLLTIMYAMGFLAVRDRLSVPCDAEPCTLRQQVRVSGSGEEEVVEWSGPPIGYAAPLRPDQVEALGRLGLTLEGYGWLGALQMGIPALLYLLIAAFLFWQKSDDWVVLWTSLMAATFPIQQTALPFTIMARQPDWLWGLCQAIALVAFFGFPLIFPNGKFVPRWTRWFMLFLVGGTALVSWFPRQFGASASFPLVIIWLLSSFAVGVFAQLYRYFRVATPAERQQFKWAVAGLFVYFVGVFLIITPLDSVLRAAAGGDLALEIAITAIPDTLWVLVSLFIPASVAISVTRYRLWDIDFVINQSLVYGALTVVLLGVLAGGFFGVRAALGSILGPGQDWVAAVIPAVAITALFNPARRWLRHFVDQRLYGIKIDYTPGKAAAPSVAAPRSTLGSYEGLELIGRGGMAEVYKATHPTLGRPVAIKVLPHSLAQDPDFRKRFEREAKTVAALKHPNIVQLFDFGEADGTAYMVIEYISGPDVGDVIKQSGPMQAARAISITREVAGALDYAHQQGLVHRDIKPSNVMLEPVTAAGSGGERTVLMDFGIARILSGNTRITASGMIGTLDYMSPEQIKDAKDVDGRADIYSLGIMLFQMLTGRLPFTASNPGALLIAHLNQPAPDPRTIRADIPEDASLAALKAMEKDPDDRFQTAGEFAAALA